MEFSLLNLKDFGTLFPNNNITDVAYKEVVNKYIIDKLDDKRCNKTISILNVKYPILIT